MDPFAVIAERRIREAMERGEFDDLPGKGKPLALGDEDPMVPEELRMAYRLLRNAGMLPPELELRKELLRLSDLLSAVTDEGERRRRRRELDYKLMQFNLMRRKPVFLEGMPSFRDRALAKLTGSSSGR
jgi:hypothetical protein